MRDIKRKIAVFLIVAICGQSFAAIVSDNDGSTFITKAEFDSLKNSFNTQIDSYNTSIDKKIDGAIASYLSGIRLSNKVELKLPVERGYTFPLRYETAEVWNDPRSPWHIPVRPECHRTDFRTTFFTCRPTSANPKDNWLTYATLSNADTATIPGKEPREAWGGVDLVKYTLRIDPRITDGFDVEPTADTRTVNSGTYKVYDINGWGFGYQVVNYNSLSHFSVDSGNSGNVQSNYAYKANEYYYPYCCGFSHDFRALSSVGTDPLKKHTAWKTNELWWGYGGNSTRYSEKNFDLPFTSTDTIYAIMNKYRAQRGQQNDQEPIIDVDQTIDNTSTVYSNTQKTGRVYGRGGVCPIIGDNFNLELTEGTYNSDKWWSQFYFYDAPVAMAAVSAATRSVALLQKHNFGFIPNNIVAANTSYDASDSEYYSKLPSPLLRYKTNAGDTHYIDEGMWLGKIDKAGAVSVNIKFEKDSGSGAKVKLHASKKPFSIDCSATDLIDITINNVKSKEPELNYNTNYNIIIEECAKNDNIYLEWLPVNTSDLPKLSSFENFALTIDN